MPNRIIKESIHTSETINELSDFQFRLWLGLITYVDDYGRGDARSAVIKGTVFPLRDKITTKDIESGIMALAEVGCIKLYEVEGKQYLYFPKWEAHQRVQNKRSKCPDPEGANEVTVSHRESPLPKMRSVKDEPIKDWKYFMDEYNTHVKSLTHIITITDERKRLVNARLREHPDISLKDVYAKIEASDFLAGRKTKWQASFDWIFEKGNFQKIIEGNYDNNKSGTLKRYDNDDFSKHQHEIKDV